MTKLVWVDIWRHAASPWRRWQIKGVCSLWLCGHYLIRFGFIKCDQQTFPLESIDSYRPIFKTYFIISQNIWLIHYISLFPADPVEVFSFKFSHEFVQSINLLSLPACHETSILKMQHEVSKVCGANSFKRRLEFFCFWISLLTQLKPGIRSLSKTVRSDICKTRADSS